MKTYIAKTGSEFMQPERITSMLAGTPWGADRPYQAVLGMVEHSLCVGVFDEQAGTQVAFARALTDYATLYYLCDVVVDPALRGRGLARLLLDAVVSYPPLQGLRGLLITNTAADLYRKYGFTDFDTCFMERRAPRG